MIVGTAMAWSPDKWNTVRSFFGLGFTAYIGFGAVVVNLIDSTVLSAILPNVGTDETRPSDYEDGSGRVLSAAHH